MVRARSAAPDAHVDALMLALEGEHGAVAVTPGGVSWLHVHQVPIRRLLRRIVLRLLATQPSQLSRASGQDHRDFVVTRRSAASGYVSYDISQAGLAYLLGLRDDDVVRCGPPGGHLPPRPWPSGTASAPVCAVSWSSRHVHTLLPVLSAAANRGVGSVVLDLSTDSAQRFPAVERSAIAVVRPPAWLLGQGGGLPDRALRPARPGRRVAVGHHRLWIPRLARLAAQTAVVTTDSTQPSWSAAVQAEAWLDQALARIGPGVLVCCNDTSPLGHLAVRAAERAGADTVYVQHGAWVEEEIAWRAQHCRHIAVMGWRDVQTCQPWRRRPDAHLHVTGQPRFDGLSATDRPRHRAYLEQLLSHQAGAAPHRIAVWACQPLSEQRHLAQLRAVLDGVRHTGRRWGLVVAPHPAQPSSAFPADLRRGLDCVAVAVADPEVGARGCLAGADALLTASSTCGIEALLLDVPVLELAFPGAHTLRLAEHGAARRCTSAAEITIALARVDRFPATVRVPAPAKAAICRWDGRSAAAVADLVSRALADGAPATVPPLQTRTPPQP
ncbi:hypothetical protein ACTWP5_29340 [Streptomyces sp. 4N509B]|uniref:hypothetical protein n=1 Tax=Streptomyces sp. 4N509B TaxID=3457413 RepID=UPI003FD0EBC8